ncbi:MAG TPA: PAS and helix-turn-helix domain-containing protein [Dongiaceae bacterium]
MNKHKEWGKAALSDVVTAIYQAASATQSWTSVIEQISQFIPGEPGGIIVSPLVLGEDPAAIRSLWKEPDGYVATYEAYFGYRDELALAHLENRHRDHFSFGNVAELMPRQSFERSEIYNNLMRDFDLEDTTGLVVNGRHKRFMLFSMYGTRWNEHDTVANRRMFDDIRPHFAAAMDLHWRLADAEGAAVAARATLDLFRTGILWLDKDGKILWMNNSAETMLALKDGLGQSFGMLTTRDNVAMKQLSLALQAAISGETVEPTVAVHRPSGRRPFSISITSANMDMAAIGGSKVAALCFVTDLHATPDQAGRALSLVYGLSSAEARVAQGLASGLKPEEIAAQHGSSIHTVRVQIKSIMAKMETTRHGDIIRLAIAAAGFVRDGTVDG